MKFLVTLAWLGLVASSSAAPKFAIVRVSDIYRELPSTAAKLKEIQNQRKAIEDNQRAEQFREIITELQGLQKQIEAGKDQIETDNGKKLVRAYEIKRQEAETLRVELERFGEAENKRINIEMVTGMRDSLNRIQEASRKLAAERNLDAVFDTSGNSNTGLPFVLYSGNAPDITADVIALLGEKPLDEKPPAEKPLVEKPLDEEPKAGESPADPNATIKKQEN